MSERDEILYWQGALDELRRTGLKTARDVAGKWQTTISGLIGAFGLVAVVKGPSTFKDLGATQSESLVLLAATSVAALLAFGALFMSAWAAQGFPQMTTWWDAYQLRDWSNSETQSAIEHLRWGRRFTIAAAIIVLILYIVVAALPIARSKASVLNAIINKDGGGIVCGVLVNAAGLAVRVNDSTTLVLAPKDQITIVDRCPD
jgi:hypothetical protein